MLSLFLSSEMRDTTQYLSTLSLIKALFLIRKSTMYTEDLYWSERHQLRSPQRMMEPPCVRNKLYIYLHKISTERPFASPSPRSMHDTAPPPFPDDVPTVPLLVIDYALLQAGDEQEIDRLWQAATELGFW